MRLAILSSYTINTLSDKIKSHLEAEFEKVDVYTNSFNQYIQDLLNKKSGLYLFRPEIVIFLFDEETWLLEQNHLYRLIILAKKKLSQTIFLIGNIVQLHSSLLPSLQWNKKNSLAEQIASSNIKLARLCQTHKGLFVVDIINLFQNYGKLDMLDYRMQYLVKNPWSEKGIEILSHRIVQQIKTIKGKRKKVIALDLDNTLWGGILGEDGIENILLSNDGIGKAYYDFQQALLKLYESGVLLVICSKNDENLTLDAIESHPYMLIKKHHLASWRINWNNKADNLISIANELNLGLDSFVFLDDSPYERRLIKFALPSVEVPDLPSDSSEYTEFLSTLSEFDTSIITEEDKKRNEMYQQEQVRNSKKLSSTSLEKFLKSLRIQVSVQKATPFTIPRIAQLTQKTNQFNLTNRKYTEEQINGFTKDKNTFVLAISSKDMVGDMGLVGVVIAKKVDKSLFLDTFLMSCRVLGRGIEEAALFALTIFCNQQGVSSITGEFIPTRKNDMVKKFYSSNHFISQQNGLYRYEIKEKKIKKPLWITLNHD